jgi:hypothetical protein
MMVATPNAPSLTPETSASRRQQLPPAPRIPAIPPVPLEGKMFRTAGGEEEGVTGCAAPAPDVHLMSGSGCGGWVADPQGGPSLLVPHRPRQSPRSSPAQRIGQEVRTGVKRRPTCWFSRCGPSPRSPQCRSVDTSVWEDQWSSGNPRRRDARPQMRSRGEPPRRAHGCRCHRCHPASRSSLVEGLDGTRVHHGPPPRPGCALDPWL